MGRIFLDYNLNLGIFLSKGINNSLGGNLLKLILLYPLIQATISRFYESYLGSRFSV
jgi:hypothetical protein